jgi:hypothetical protein
VFRYVARRPVRSRLLAVRAERIAAERSAGGFTTDDDALSSAELRLTGKFCPRSERRQQLERQQRHQRRAEELVRIKNLSMESTAPNSMRRPEPAAVEQQQTKRMPLAPADTAAVGSSPGRFGGRAVHGVGGMTNSPSCGEFQQHGRSPQPQPDTAAAMRRCPQDGGGTVAAEKRYSYHEESYSNVPNDILVSVMTV